MTVFRWFRQKVSKVLMYIMVQTILLLFSWQVLHQESLHSLAMPSPERLLHSATPDCAVDVTSRYKLLSNSKADKRISLMNCERSSGVSTTTGLQNIDTISASHNELCL